MATISLIVSKLVENQPFLEEALARGIINYAALAEELQPRIEKELKKKIKSSAVMMALRRLSENMACAAPKKLFFTTHSRNTFRESDVTIKTGLFEMTVCKTESASRKIQKLHGIIDISKGDILGITSGIHEITIISNNRHKQKIEKLLETENDIKTIKGIASLTVKIPVSASDTVGMFYIATKALNWENINIVEILSTLTEMTFIIKEDDVPRAFEVLNNLLKSAD